MEYRKYSPQDEYEAIQGSLFSDETFGTEEQALEHAREHFEGKSGVLFYLNEGKHGNMYVFYRNGDIRIDKVITNKPITFKDFEEVEIVTPNSPVIGGSFPSNRGLLLFHPKKSYKSTIKWIMSIVDNELLLDGFDFVEEDGFVKERFPINV